MKHQWTGDNRDLVKWGAIYRLAEETRSSIVYVPMLTPDEGTLDDHKGEPIAPAVIQHFRDAHRSRHIAWPAGTRFDAVEGWREDRPSYFRQALGLIAAVHADGDRRAVVLVDPDTGIQPRSGGDAKHVTREEISLLFSHLRTGDVLAVYQHARKEKNWDEASRVVLAETLSMPAPDVDVVRWARIAWDVVVLVARKP